MEQTQETVMMDDAELDADFEAAWNGEDGIPAQEPGDLEEDQLGEPGEPAARPEGPEEEPTGTDQPPTFTLKHLDEVRTVGRDEIVKLAQQGMDYDRIRTERDQLRAYRNEADPALALVKAYAQKSGMSVGSYLDYCRGQELLAGGASEQDAAAQIAAEKRQADARARQEQSAQARRTDMERFLQTFPAVKPDEIPGEVWETVAKGEGLTSAYTMYRNRRLESELAAERQNRANAQRSTGSMTSKGAGNQDEIDKYWYADG